MKRQWTIRVVGGVGDFSFTGTEAEAEKLRRHKARWERAVARKYPKGEEPPVKPVATT